MMDDDTEKLYEEIRKCGRNKILLEMLGGAITAVSVAMLVYSVMVDDPWWGTAFFTFAVLSSLYNSLRSRKYRLADGRRASE